MNKPALLIVNLGTPDSPSYFHVFKYLREFLMDGRVIDIPAFFRFILVTLIICPLRSFSSGKIYKQLWDLSGGESPLLKNTRELTTKLNEAQEKFNVFYALCFQFTNNFVRRLLFHRRFFSVIVHCDESKCVLILNEIGSRF